ncbi:hypothetical protein O3P69_019165 [Scylla paramamosain]|uniref:Nephrin n=1 Tax=Scylla paramamosain TaxID=85552 RepID=A0AAW0SW44_SCYPA
MSSSRVSLRASRRHHGQRLSCTALNPLFPDHPLADSLLLNVTYPPVASLELGGRASSVVVQEGEDVTFTCNVDANPPSYKTTWFLEDRPLQEGPGVEMSVTHLSLSSVTRLQAGPYTCSASNVEGDARSTPLNLTVNYAPVCDDPAPGEARKVYATGVGRPVNVTCGVLASPPLVRFSWVFNNSMSSERLPGDQVFTMTDGSSVAQFRPKLNQDVGTLQCWAQNAVGRMMEPCMFQVGRSAPPACAVVNKTYDSLAVACEPGFDGGLPQTFSARVFESVTGIGQVNVTSHLPNFTFAGLTPGLDYLIEVLAVNELGPSAAVTLEAFTYKMAENRMRNEKVEEVTSPETEEKRGSGGGGIFLTQVVLVAGAAVVVLVVLGSVTAVVRLDAWGGVHPSRAPSAPPSAPRWFQKVTVRHILQGGVRPPRPPGDSQPPYQGARTTAAPPPPRAGVR